MSVPLNGRITFLGFRGSLLWGATFGLVMNFGGFALALDLPTRPAITVEGFVSVFATKALESGRLCRS